MGYVTYHGWRWSRGYVYDWSGDLLAMQYNGAVSWYHQDPVVKSRRVVSAAGATTSAVELDPWGAATSRMVNSGQQPRLFTSYLRDGVGSDDAQHRRYNRYYARFEQPDPADSSYDLADPQSLNRYSYTQNDPVNFIDPSGLNAAPSQTCYRVVSGWIHLNPEGPASINVSRDEVVCFGGGGISGGYADGGGGSQNPSRPPIPAENLAGNVADLLKGDCGTFVTSLIDAVAAATRNPAHSNNALSLFNQINGRQGGVVFEDNLRVGGRPAGGTVSGAIGNAAHPPVIHIQTSFLIAGILTPRVISATQHTYAITAIHETIHHAGGNGWYLDEQLARAAHALTGAPGLPKDGADAFEWSRYWDNVLKDKCPPVRK